MTRLASAQSNGENIPMKTSILAGATLLASTFALAACGGSASADADRDGTITQEEVEAAVAGVEIRPGQWENTVEFVDIEFDDTQLPEEARAFVVPILDSLRGRVTTTNSCVTEEEASRPQAEMFSGNEDADCEYTRFDFAGGEVNMEMTCSDPASGTAKITNTGTYSETAYDMQMRVELEQSEMGAMAISATSKGRHMGACSSE